MENVLIEQNLDYLDSRKDHVEKRRKIVLLWLGGMSRDRIARRTGLHLNSITAILSKAERNIREYGQEQLGQLLKNTFVESLTIHKDASSELIRQFVLLQVKRDNLLANNNDSDTGIEKEIKQYNAQLRQLVAELSKNDLTFVDTMTKMGVPRVNDNKEEKGPIDTSSSYYSAIDTDGEAIRNQQVKSLERQLVRARKLPSGKDKSEAEESIAAVNKYRPADGVGAKRKC